MLAVKKGRMVIVGCRVAHCSVVATQDCRVAHCKFLTKSFMAVPIFWEQRM